MKIIVTGESNLTANMVRNVFEQASVQGVEVVYAKEADELKAVIDDDSLVLVDWEQNPDVDAMLVATARKASQKAPILLACTKIKSGTTFPGMKAGASGVVHKPFEPEELVKTVVNAAKQAKTKKASVNVEFINPFIDATLNTLKTMCGIDATRKKLFLKDDYAMLGDVSGVMGMAGAATGSVVISLPSRLACIVVGRMLGEEPHEKLDADVCDGVGEVINMIAGQAKASLVKTKYHFTISLPSVISGAGHEISHKKGTPNIVVLFEVDGMDFALQVCLIPTDE